MTWGPVKIASSIEFNQKNSLSDETFTRQAQAAMKSCSDLLTWPCRPMKFIELTFKRRSPTGLRSASLNEKYLEQWIQNSKIFTAMSKSTRRSLCTLTANTTSKLDILGHDGDTLSVNSAKIGVLKKTDKISLGSLLKCKNCVTLETQIRLMKHSRKSP